MYPLGSAMPRGLFIYRSPARCPNWSWRRSILSILLSMKQPILTNTSGIRWRAFLPLLIFALIAIPCAVYLNKSSAKWVPEADAKVQAARKQAALQAFEALRDEAARHPDAAAAQIAYARALTDRGAFVEALLPTERAIAIEPANAANYIFLGDILGPLDYRQETVAAYREAIRRDPNALVAYQHLGDMLAASGKPDEAEKIYKEAAGRAPDSPGPKLSLAQLYLQQNRNNSVVAVLEPLLKSSDPPIAALYIGGKASVALGQNVHGIELFQQAIKKQPDFADAYHALGSALANQGKTPEGIAALQRAVELTPTNPTYHYALGNALLADLTRADRLEQAQKEFERSLTYDPRAEFAHYYYGITLEQKGEIGAATREYRRVLELNPEFSSCYYRLGTLYKLHGRPAEAKKLLDYFDKMSKTAISKVHGDRRQNSELDTADLRYKRGIAALAAGRNDMARSEFQAALVRDPNHAGAKRELGRMGAGKR